MADLKSTAVGSHTVALHKKWDEALCPICMDHPHNAVLLRCSSFDKGCRPYICDSSYRHSNCLDRFKKYFSNSASQPDSFASFIENAESSESEFRASGSRNNSTEANEHNFLTENSNGSSTGMFEVLGDSGREEPHTYLDPLDVMSLPRAAFGSFRESSGEGETADSSLNLKCPLCRGTVKSWEIEEEARHYLNSKPRSCSLESCPFSGNYGELRRHARKLHPTTRPATTDPSRLRRWHHLEYQQEIGDVFSAIRSAIPGAIAIGDYVIEAGEGFPAEMSDDSVETSGPLLTSFILYQMMRPFSPVSVTSHHLSRAWRRYRRTNGSSTERRHLWGENLLGLREDDWDLTSDVGEDVQIVPTRRRRLTRSRSEGLQ